MRFLNTIDVMVTPVGIIIVTFVLIVISGALVLTFVTHASETVGKGCMIGAIITAIIALFVGVIGAYTKDTGRNKYEVLIEENVNLEEFYEQYEIVGRRGDIWVIEEIEK